MKVIRCDLPREHKEITILPLADWHLGDPRADYKMITQWLDYLKATDNAYCILNGDLMDSATKHSIGDIYSAALQPMEQLKQCVTLFEPVKHKILAVLPGNHENRIYRMDGIDTTAMMCAQLGLECYAPEGALLFVRFGQERRQGHKRPLCYTVYVQHGSGGGRLEGAKIKRLSDLSAIVDADVYIHSHTHLPAVFKTGYFRVDTANSAVSHVTKLFVNTSSALDYGGYGEVQGYKPTSKDTPLIRLDGTRKNASAAL